MNERILLPILVAGGLAAPAFVHGLAPGAPLSQESPGQDAGTSDAGTSPDTGALVRVKPRLDVSVEAPERAFQSDVWRERLTQADLAAREASFEELVREAWRDPRVVRFLEGLRDDAAAPELAWTARLALRELSGARWLFASPGERPDGAGGPMGLFDSPLEELLRSRMPHLRAFGPPRAGGPFARFGAPQGPGGPNANGATQETKRVKVERTPEGWRILIVENVDGEETRREYVGETLELMLEENPELSDELGFHSFELPDSWRMDLEGPGGGLVEGLRGFHRMGPGAGLLEPEGELRFFFAPQSKSAPVRRDVLGVRIAPISEEHAAELGLDPGRGLYVRAVLPGTIAHVAGLSSGDVLLQMNGRLLASAQEVTDLLPEAVASGAVRLEWIDTLGEHRSGTWRPDAD